jgi:DNA-binding transcriptional regulator YhcF (GntR family)
MDFHDNKPIYLQLADQVMDDVQSGVVSGGDRLPSVREYAARTGVNANTVMRTYTHLQQEGVIYNRRGIGYFYADDAPKIVREMRLNELLDKEIYNFMDRLLASGITPERFNEIYTEYAATRS